MWVTLGLLSGFARSGVFVGGRKRSSALPHLPHPPPLWARLRNLYLYPLIQKSTLREDEKNPSRKLQVDNIFLQISFRIYEITKGTLRIGFRILWMSEGVLQIDYCKLFSCDCILRINDQVLFSHEGVLKTNDCILFSCDCILRIDNRKTFSCNCVAEKGYTKSLWRGIFSRKENLTQQRASRNERVNFKPEK